MIRNATSYARRAFRTAADAIRSTVAPASLVRSRADETVPDPADVFTPEEMPAPEEIAEAAQLYTEACDQARAAERAKRKARRLLDRLPAGVYADFEVERVPSSRTTPDLEAIRERLGSVPTRMCAPSLMVRRIVQAPADIVTFPASSEALTAPAAA
ncbi:hypothetical protein [Streptomyces sp. DSM 41013]